MNTGTLINGPQQAAHKNGPACAEPSVKTSKGIYPFVHCPCLQHWSHFCPVQFCFAQWVQTCFFTLPPPANTGPASTTAVMANKNAFLIYLELNEVKIN
jgi:hypothetical protein